ncbi:Bug family tripartite tricarboxylate transporter substrate binding protein [Mesorhizobium sp. BR1-1-2]|uniref:Bug family tripartite tricarboxylate transporter substrate binding protein n=1 Tax=Mesorhizobium sp. BR1-1-2 TaxID=2876652 RepID=UPI001CCD84A7|nr:tripartite tricarboxylate transporter substrate binding protein [Mesorhizobium sp. BR1-1-2]MBZ9965859.1 tripartite tricarboxylate transporter substrate binding protein [Mesorhizobium sp. BR1-1-2]
MKNRSKFIGDNSGGLGGSVGLDRRTFLLASAAVASSLVARPSFASEYPDAPVHLVVSTGAGSGTDIIGRVVAKQLTQQLGTPFVVENHTGAGGIVGNEFVAQSKPDGYTGLIMDTGMAITANMYRSLPYDSLSDFTPITQISRVPTVLVVNPSLNIKTLKDLIDYAHANPGKLNYGSSGVGGSIQCYFERFKAAAKVDIKHIPYDGGSTMMAAALRNDVQLLMTAVATTKSYVKSGQFLPLAVTAEKDRVPSMPDVPTMAEAGLPNMAIYSWSGLGGPKGLSNDIADKLHLEVAKALADPTVKAWFTAQDTETVGSSPDEFSKFFKNEVDSWQQVIKEANIPTQG